MDATKECYEIPVNNHRYGHIINLRVEKMEEYCNSGEEKKKGEFGSLYKYEKPNKEVYLIKKLIFTKKDENKDRAEKYYKELYHETILHPHVLPIIAHAEDILQDRRVVYLMYPYMENGSVCDNIIRENNGEILWPDKNESNSSIWTRCIYQVVSALDYLHNNGKHDLRGPIFHRNVTSRTILFNTSFNAKLCDFGRAVEANVNAVKATNIQSFSVPGYHPRTMDGTCYKASYDVHSFCVVILEILTGEEVKNENTFSIPKEDILKKIKHRSKPKNNVAMWIREDLRDKLTQKAWQIISMDETEMADVKAADILQIIKDARIETYKLYKEERNNERCVSCYVNKKAKNLPLKGKDCDNCAMFCVHCLTDYHNELICPLHGPTRPPFGDHVYGVFVAGNHVNELDERPNENACHAAKDIAKIFIRDAKKLADVLTSKFPLILGARTDNFEVVTPTKPGSEGEMKILIQKAFNKIKELIRNDRKSYTDKTSPLFIFYFSGHSKHEEETDKCSPQNASKYLLYLGGINETITTEWLKGMLDEWLHEGNVLIVLDCCFASGHNLINKKEESRFSIYQLSSSGNDCKSVSDKTRGSYFTHFLCQALRGIENNKLSCKDCGKENKNLQCQSFHIACSGTQKVTMNDVGTYIQSHYDLLELKMKVTMHAQNADIIELSYYKHLEKRKISIHLEGAESRHKYENYSFTEVPDSIASLRRDIVKYIEKTKVPCQILEVIQYFHSDLYESPEDKNANHKYLNKYITHLVAIYQQHEQDTEELTCLNDLLKIRPSRMSLVAKIRHDVNGLRNGLIKCDMIKKAMTVSYQESYFSKRLAISQECMQLVCSKEYRGILEEIEFIEKGKNKCLEAKWLLNNLYQLVAKCLIAGAYDEKETKIIKLRLYEEFSILQFE
ncbi:hypothetical protein CHS0354_003522 [Potamilus streckersoni]|nr:hypothetical protein CHS0354_003522 [Potamilus streckersoni]